MNSIFSVDEEIEFSDDEIDFGRGKGKLHHGISDSQNASVFTTVPVRDSINTQTHEYLEVKKALNKGNSILLEDESNRLFCSSKDMNALSDDDIFGNIVNDETDKLLSQIDLPMCGTKDKFEDKYPIKHQQLSSVNKDDGKRRLPELDSTLHPIRKCMDFIISNPVNISMNSKKDNNGRRDFFPISDDGDDLENNYYSTTTSNRHHISNKGSSSRSTLNIADRRSEMDTNQSRKTVRDVFDNDKNLPTPFSNDSDKRKGHNFALDKVNVTLEKDVTPVKVSAGTGASNKRKISDSHGKTVKSASKQRRFPGPAGLLPSLDNYSCLDRLKSPEANNGKRTLTPLTPKTPIQSILRLSQDEDFNRSVWIDVKNQMSKLFPRVPYDNISEILGKASMDKLKNGKVALFCGMIKSFSVSGSGGKLVIKDPSGEINGTLHKNVLDEYESDLSQGSGLILKDISVYSPSIKKHYINIIPANIIQVFPAEFNDVFSTQSQPTQSSRNDKVNFMDQRVSEKENFFDEVKSKEYVTNDNENSHVLGNEDELDRLFADDLCVF